jgi:hypothetical protein
MTTHHDDPYTAGGAHLHRLLKKATAPARRPGSQPPGDNGSTGQSSPFPELMEQVMTTAERFGHRQHVHLTWLAVRRCGTTEAVGLVSDGIQGVARYAGAPQKYNTTVSRAWVELVGHHADQSDADDFDAFADQNPALLDKKLLARFYQSSTLAGTAARTGWVEPDRTPFPWQHTQG